MQSLTDALTDVKAKKAKLDKAVAAAQSAGDEYQAAQAKAAALYAEFQAEVSQHLPDGPRTR